MPGTAYSTLRRRKQFNPVMAAIIDALAPPPGRAMRGQGGGTRPDLPKGQGAGRVLGGSSMRGLSGETRADVPKAALHARGFTPSGARASDLAPAKGFDVEPSVVDLIDARPRKQFTDEPLVRDLARPRKRRKTYRASLPPSVLLNDLLYGGGGGRYRGTRGGFG